MSFFLHLAILFLLLLVLDVFVTFLFIHPKHLLDSHQVPGTEGGLRMTGSYIVAFTDSQSLQNKDN